MNVDRFLRAAQWRLQTLPRRVENLKSDVVLEEQPFELTSTVGYKLAAKIVRPKGRTNVKPLVITPGIHQGIAELSSWASPVTLAELARLGFCVLAYDPAGRGQSWGEEDFGGLEHQDDLTLAIRAAAVLPGVSGQVGVLSLSLGIAAAAGALAESDVPVSWLVDWEGPCDREIITSGGTIMVPAAGHTLSDEDYWQPREATRHIGRVRCGYVRLQAFPDHAQPQEVRHADRMMQAVKNGQLPWFQLNDHPRNFVPDRPMWLGGGIKAANEAILRKLQALLAGEARAQ